ncbi:hypothetical protein [Photorhabdus viridis]|uniref:hypothetical protein n=1 Tax=Photorhabdus viridis TaxID=3163327 RepID=UPI003306D6BB
MNIENKEMLYTLSKEELAKALTPYYKDFYDQLSDYQKSNISLDIVVNDAHKRLFLNNLTHLRIDRELKPIEYAGVSPCILAIGTVVADAFGLVFQFLGINEAETRAATRALLKELGQDTLRGLLATIEDFKNATSLLDKAKIIWSLISEIKNAVGFSGIIKALKDSMHWYDWVITGVTAAAQLTIWFATDGAAFIAELALAGAAIATLGIDAANAVHVCS